VLAASEPVAYRLVIIIIIIISVVVVIAVVMVCPHWRRSRQSRRRLFVDFDTSVDRTLGYHVLCFRF